MICTDKPKPTLAQMLVKATTQSEKPPAQVALLPREVAIGFLIIITGAVMMLISLALDWYAVHGVYAHDNFILKFDFLNNSDYLAYSGFHWGGTTLPLILMIAFGSITILSTVYALAAGQRFKKLWSWLSLLSAVVIIANFVYFLVALWDNGYIKDVTPQVGWVVALIGAIAVGIGAITIGIGSKKKPLS